MSTSFYACRPARICGECRRPHDDYQRLIGNSAGGWRFIFKGDETKSFADWMEYLSAPGVVVMDEYGKTWDLEKFRSLVEVKQSLRVGRPDLEPGCCWTCPGGFDFCRRIC